MDLILNKQDWSTRKTVLSILVFALTIRIIIYQDNGKLIDSEKNQIQISKVFLTNFIEYFPVKGIVNPRNSVNIDAVQGGIVQEIIVDDGPNLSQGML